MRAGPQMDNILDASALMAAVVDDSGYGGNDTDAGSMVHVEHHVSYAPNSMERQAVYTSHSMEQQPAYALHGMEQHYGYPPHGVDHQPAYVSHGMEQQHVYAPQHGVAAEHPPGYPPHGVDQHSAYAPHGMEQQQHAYAPQAIEQEHHHQQQQPAGFMPPAGYVPPPAGYAPPTGYAPPAGYAAPTGYAQPAGYAAPTGYMPLAGYAQPAMEQSQAGYGVTHSQEAGTETILLAEVDPGMAAMATAERHGEQMPTLGQMPPPKIKGKTMKKLAPRVTAPRWTDNRIKEAGRPCYRCNGYGGKCMEARPMTEGGKWAKHNLSPKDMLDRATDKRHCGQCKIPIPEELERYGVPAAPGAGFGPAGSGATADRLNPQMRYPGFLASSRMTLPMASDAAESAAAASLVPLVDAAVVQLELTHEGVLHDSIAAALSQAPSTLGNEGAPRLAVQGPPGAQLHHEPPTPSLELALPSHSITPFAPPPLPVGESFGALAHGGADESPAKRSRHDGHEPSFLPS